MSNKSEQEAIDAISKAHGTLNSYFANKSVEKKQNWDNLEKKMGRDPNNTATSNTGNTSQSKSSGGSSGGNSLDDLEKLAELQKKGILTEEEFQAKKRQILGL